MVSRKGGKEEGERGSIGLVVTTEVLLCGG